MAGSIPLNTTFLDWLLSRCEVREAGYTSPCWLWLRSKSTKGYAKATLIKCCGGPRKIRVHREAYQQLVGPIPADLVTDHLCRNRACCNPEHLEPVTGAVNNARIPPELRAVPLEPQTHCKRGHEFTIENTIVTKKQRLCRACRSLRRSGKRPERAAYMRAWHAKRRAERLLKAGA